MSEDLAVAQEKRMTEVKPSKRDILLNNKVVYAITIINTINSNFIYRKSNGQRQRAIIFFAR